MILSKWAIWGIKKCRFVKDQVAKGLLDNLGFRIPLSKVPILGDILFSTNIFLVHVKSYRNTWNS